MDEEEKILWMAAYNAAIIACHESPKDIADTAVFDYRDAVEDFG